MYKIHTSTMDSRGDPQGEKIVIVNIVKRDVNTGNSIFFQKIICFSSVVEVNLQSLLLISWFLSHFFLFLLKLIFPYYV